MINETGRRTPRRAPSCASATGSVKVWKPIGFVV
jgi:hypothetical protein